MPSALIAMHFPDGKVEFAYGSTERLAGDTLWRDGERWEVTSVARLNGRLTVTLAPANGTGPRPRRHLKVVAPV
jgi:hypothetical protein